MPAPSVTNADHLDATPPNEAKSVALQSADKFCQNAARHFGQAGTESTLSEKGVHIRCAPILEALHKLVPKSLRQLLFNLSHHPPLSSHPG